MQGNQKKPTDSLAQNSVLEELGKSINQKPMNIEKNQVKKDKIIDSENDRKKKVNYFINSL